MDYSPQILEALQEKLDIATVYPIVYGMTPQTIELFVGSVFTKLLAKIAPIMEQAGEMFISKNDHSGLAYAIANNGVKLPHSVLLDISKHIIKRSRMVARWVAPIYGQDGDLWYCTMYLDMPQLETPELPKKSLEQ